MSRYTLTSEDGEVFQLTSDALVGRVDSCDLVIDDAQVSREHARLEIGDSGVAVIDLGSVNGTCVGEQRIQGRAVLEDGDKVSFGPRSFKFAGVPDETESTGMWSADDTQPATDEEGEQGTIVVMPRNRNLPPIWDVKDDDASHTMVISRDTVEQMIADQEKAKEEIERVESTIDAPTLLITSGTDAGLPYKLQNFSDMSFWTVGKGSDSSEVSIVIDDASVSSVHAKLVHKEGRWKIIDQMSTNHTYVNGDEYNSRFLSSRDILRFGAVSAVFLLPTEGATIATAPEKPKNGAPKRGFFARLMGLFSSK